MLFSYHIPIIDLRSFFVSEVGRVRGFNHDLIGTDGTGIHGNIFLRSIGMPKRRLLGPGDSTINEFAFFSFDKKISYSLSNRNRPLPVRIRNDRIRSRYFTFDKTIGRLDISFPIKFSPNVRYEQKNPMEIFQSTEGFLLEINDSSAGYSPRTASNSSNNIAQFFQSRTTSEIALKNSAAIIQTVFGNDPIIFMECLKSELFFSDTIQKIDIEIPQIQLFHWYPRSQLRSWIIVRDDQKRETYQNSRLLRMYLSKQYCLQASFRTALRMLPSVADEIEKSSVDELFVDEYTQFIIKNKKAIAKLSKAISNVSGQELGPLSRYAHNMISADEIDKIEREHEKIVKRRNVLHSIGDEITKDLVMGERYSPTFQINNKNTSFNIFGKQSNSQEISNKFEHLIAKPTVKNLEIIETIKEIGELFQVYGTQIDKGRQETFFNLLIDMQKIAAKAEVSGPLVLKRCDQLEKLVRNVSFGRDKLDSHIKSLKEKILA